MRLAVRCLSMLVIVALLASVSQAQEAKKEKGKGRKQNIKALFQPPKGVELTAEQQTKVAELAKQFESRVVEAQKKAALTKDQRTARKAALEKAKADGQKGKQANAAADAAISLTEEQKQGQQEMKSLKKEIQIAILGVLTDEQKAAAQAGKKKKGKKPAA